ncbi:MAG: hypothetical protein HQK81_04070 [Desulfovibrionaceae bacterium]|nr:hypothetical protein [Desulfovibrionaceae bacterium]MBF0513220.1 hypothetical protein [Desulfovibrionaceae bacterium]
MFLSAFSGLSSGDRRTILGYAALIFGIYALVILWAATDEFRVRTDSDAHHSLRMSPTDVEPGLTPADPLPEGGDYTSVRIGTYIEDIDNLSIKDSYWSTTFYIWYHWKGDSKLDPGSKMILVDGAINKKELLEDYHGPDGENYQRFRISAKVIKYFDTARVPIEDHMLNIYIEDGARDGTKLRFAADDTSNISSRLRIPGFKITAKSNVVKNHTYRSSYGDPRTSSNQWRTFSQYVAAVQIKRTDFGFYLKIFLSLFMASLVTLASFFIKASDVGPRFSLPTAAFFGAVANTYLANSLLPSSGSFGLIDQIAGLGLFTIFTSIAMAIVSNYYTRKKQEDVSVALDRVMFLVTGVMYLAGNIIVPWCARS